MGASPNTGTSFAAWLERRGETPWAFARRLGMYKQTVNALAGRSTRGAPAYFKTGTLERVAAETGISVQQLYADWRQCEPQPPRKYTRRAGDAGDQAE